MIFLMCENPGFNLKFYLLAYLYLHFW